MAKNELSDEQILDRIIDLKADDFKWDDIGRAVGLNAEAARGRYRRWKRENIKEEKQGKKPSITIQEHGNYTEVRSKGTRIKTIEQLIIEAEIDLDIWEIIDATINKWEVGAKHQDVNLTFVEGVSDGWVEKKPGLMVEPLFQVKLKLIKKQPEAIKPTIQAVEIHLSPSKGRKSLSRGDTLQRVLVLPDAHIGFRKENGSLIPFHDRLAMDVALQIALDCEFEHVVFLGDWLDLPEWTDKFVRSPEFTTTTQPSIYECGWWLAQFRMALPDAKFYFLEGNHEARMKRILSVHIPYAYGLKAADEMHLPPSLSVPKLLSLDSLDIEWYGDYPDEELWLTDWLLFKHGDVVRQGSGATASAVVNKQNQYNVFGHIHRLELASRSIQQRDGQFEITAFSPGCLCRIDGLVPGVRARQNWQQGIGIVEYNVAMEICNITPVPIRNAQAWCNGKRYVGDSPIDVLSEDMEYDF